MNNPLNSVKKLLRVALKPEFWYSGLLVYKWKPMLTRPLGRPKNRWGNDITNDMKKLKIKNWTSCIQDRNKWNLNVEKAKTFKE